MFFAYPSSSKYTIFRCKDTLFIGIIQYLSRVQIEEDSSLYLGPSRPIGVTVSSAISLFFAKRVWTRNIAPIRHPQKRDDASTTCPTCFAPTLRFTPVGTSFVELQLPLPRYKSKLKVNLFLIRVY